MDGIDVAFISSLMTVTCTECLRIARVSINSYKNLPIKKVPHAFNGYTLRGKAGGAFLTFPPGTYVVRIKDKGNHPRRQVAFVFKNKEVICCYVEYHRLRNLNWREKLQVHRNLKELKAQAEAGHPITPDD